MNFEGDIHKMETELADVVQYHLRLGEHRILMNDLIGKKIHMTFKGYHICFCGKEKKKVFAQNFCYNCFQTLPQASPSVMRPELCQAHLGIGRDIEWEKANFVQPHFVYLASTDTVKVGVTRAVQIPTRWIDQGAKRAIRLAETPHRHLAGVIEVALKKHMKDKTNWRNMLKGVDNLEIDLVAEKERVIELLPEELKQYVVDDNEVTEISYPVERFSLKPKSLSFSKQPEIEGVLAGIRGQYLIFDDDRVINMRKHEGFVIEFSSTDAEVKNKEIQGSLF